jgi:hypothetical protein
MVGRLADLYVASGTGTVMTGQATTSLGGGVYQITLAARRAINPNAALTVLDGVTTVSPSNYRVAFGNGKIIFTNGYTPAGAVTVTGEFLTLSQAAQGVQWALNAETILEDSHTFGAAWKEHAAVMSDATITFERLYNDSYFPTSIGGYYVLALYLNVSGGSRYLCAAQCSSVGVSTGNNSLIRENASFSVHGQLDYVAA